MSPQQPTHKKETLMFKNALVAAGLVLASLASAPAALGQDYPGKPVKIIVPYPPGSSPDALARILSEQLARRINQTVVVENKAGAGGMIGAKAVSESAPDGATLLMYTPAWPAARIFMKKPPIAVPEALEPVTIVGEGRFAFTAAGALPAKSFDEMVAHARANPGKLNFATTGLGDSLLYFHAMTTEKGLKIETVQYKGSAEYVAALIANDVQLAFTPEYSMLPHVKEGRLKVLAVTGETRSKAYPDAKTFQELGLPMIRNNWMAIFAPQGTPGTLVQRINADLTAIIRSPEVSRRIQDLYFEPVGSSPEQLRRRIDNEITEWSALARKVGIEAQ
jgi:tripartite-type tricarboxylate transporter receptor subunit TctC